MNCLYRLLLTLTVLLLSSTIANATTPFNGVLQGDFSVSPSGAATYTVPIEVPPGINGLQPNLALSYNSQAGNGLLGVGWGLSGLSSITRCPKTLEQNGEIAGIKFDNTDRFCMNGQQLVAVSGVYGASGTEYRTEIESFTKVVSYGTSEAGGPNYFRVWDKSGQITEYGNSPVYIRNQQTSERYSYVWPVSKVSDRFGNEMTFTYTKNTDEGYHYISRIDYAGGNSSLVFDYEDRGDATHFNIAGSKITIPQRMKNIKIFQASILVRDYLLTYSDLSITGKSRITKLDEYTVGGVHKSGITFSWTQQEIKAKNWSWVNGHGIGDAGWTYVDLFGDGKPVYYTHHKNGTHFATRLNQDGTVQNWRWPGGHGVGDAGWRFADLFGDGRKIYHTNNKNGKHFATRLNSDGTVKNWTWTGGHGLGDKGNAVVDLFGDGREVYYTHNRNGTHFATRLNQDGTVKNWRWSGGHGVGDAGWRFANLFGDGRRIYHTSNKNGTHFATQLNSNGTVQNWTWRGGHGLGDKGNAVVDLFGDGREVYYTHNRNGTHFATRLSQDGTVQNWRWPGGHGVGDAGWRFASLFGDGRRIYHTSNKNGTHFATRLNQDGTLQNWTWRGGHGLGDGGNTVVDLFGNGIDGYYTHNKNRTHFVTLFSLESPDIIREITFSIDQKISVSYKPATDASVYKKYDFVNYPIRDFQSPMHVVSSYSTSNGIGGANSYSYKYEGAKLNLHGRGLLGFSKIVETDNQTNIKRATYYKQQTISGFQNPENNFWLNGLVDKKTTSYNGLDIEIVDNTWSVRLSDKGLPFPYKSSINTKIIEPTNSLVTTDRTTLNSNVTAFGLVQNSTTTSHKFGTTKQITNTPCANDVANWLVGKVCLISTTSSSSSLTGGVNARSETVKTKYEYSPKGKLAKKISFLDTNVALTEEYQYNLSGNIWKHTISGKDGTATGNITTRTNRTDYVYSANELTVTLTHEQDVQHSETWVYDRKTGAAKSTTDANNLTTSWLYDGFGRKLKETRADNTETNWTYLSCNISTYQRDPNCNGENEVYYVRITHSGQPTETYYNDVLNRTIRTETSGPNGTAIFQNIEYNALGLVKRESNNYINSPNYWTTTIYDEIGRIKKALLPGNIDTNSPDIEYSYLGFFPGYGIKNIITTHRKGANSATLVDVHYLDEQGNLLSTRDADYNTINYTYTPFSFLETVTDPQFNVVNYQYDPAGNKTLDTDPDMGQWSYRYDALGLLRETTDSKGQRFTINYDTLDRTKTRSDHTTSETSLWEYDSATGKGIGLLHKVSRSSDGYVETNSYDNLGRLSKTIFTLDGNPYNINYSYDVNSRLIKTTYPRSGSQGRFAKINAYDSSGYLTNIKNSSGLNYWSRVSTNENYKVTWSQLGNGLNTFKNYSPTSGLPKKIQTGHYSNNIQNLEYGFDNVGNLEFREDHNLKDLLGRVSVASSGIKETYTYDSLNRLTHTTVAGFAGFAGKQYSYDSIGNIEYSSDLGNYTYGQGNAGPHAVTYVDGASLSYDANGGMVQGRGRTISYNSDQKPISISQAGVTSSFKYGPEQRRYKKVVNKSSGTTTTHYVSTLFEKIEKGAVTEYKNYIYAGNTAIATFTITETGSGSSNKHRYLHHDHQGSVVAITDENGIIKERFNYDVYGKRITAAEWNDGFIATLISNITTRSYTGHEILEEHQLVHMNGRIYDPELARFLSADPLVKYPESTQGWNRYSYVDNNPLSRVDPSGYGWVDIRGALKVIVGVALIAIDMTCGAGTCSAGGNLSRIGV